MENSPLIHCEQLRDGGDTDIETSNTLNLSANAGEIISIIGPDHNAKSNWLKIIAGITEADSGHLHLTGKNTLTFEKDDWVKMRTQFAYVHANTAILSAANALQNMMLPVMYHKMGDANELREKAQLLLQEIGAGNNLDLLPAYLEKEQRYKIAVARALMLNQLALFLEDPFSAIELPAIWQFQQFLLNKVSADNLLLLLVTDNSQFALNHSDKIIYISKSKILHFDKQHAVQDCNDPEVQDYLSL